MCKYFITSFFTLIFFISFNLSYRGIRGANLIHEFLLLIQQRFKSNYKSYCENVRKSWMNWISFRILRWNVLLKTFKCCKHTLLLFSVREWLSIGREWKSYKLRKQNWISLARNDKNEKMKKKFCIKNPLCNLDYYKSVL